MIRVRVVKVIVQPILVADDGESLKEIPVQPTEVAASDWAGYSSGGFAEALGELETQLNDGADA